VSISPHAATEYLRNPVSTILDLNNPNQLAAKAVNKAGQVGEPIPPPPGLPLYSRPAGPAAAMAIPPPPAPLPATQVGTMPPLENPGATPNTMWTSTQPKAGFETPSKMVSSLRPPSNVKGPSITASQSAAAPPSGIVGAEFRNLKLSNLVTPRQQKTLETLIAGPRYKSMDAVDKAAAIRAVLSQGQ